MELRITGSASTAISAACRSIRAKASDRFVLGFWPLVVEVFLQGFGFA